MSTRSSTRNLFPPLEDPERTIRRRTRVDPNSLNDFEEINMAANENGDDGLPPAGGGLPVPDLRIMEELCQPTLNGRGRFNLKRISLTGFPTEVSNLSNTYISDSSNSAFLIIRMSQSRQHDKSELASYYLTD
ncbi:hypothetical protein Tco_0014205 [Tanacetum coccineum]